MSAAAAAAAVASAVWLAAVAVATQHDAPVVKRYHSAVPQQSIYTILGSIEERLRNLENIYSTHLVHTLETKLDQYQKKIDALEGKISKLDTMVSSSLDKLSESIHEKETKDETARSDLNVKLDTIHGDLDKKIAYLDTKIEESFGNVKTKVDATLTRLEKIEENQMQRDSELQSEISEVLFAIDELKSSTANVEQNIMNIANDTYYETLNVKEQLSKTEEYLNNEVVDKLKQLGETTGLILNATEAGNQLQNTIRDEIKEDFNSYANKVADMNTEIWKNMETLQNELKSAIAQSIKTEIQKLLKSLHFPSHFGGPGYNIGGGTYYLDIGQILQENFEKILNNQYKFLESCHRVQMDESQIESEIGVTLEKLANMLENILHTQAEEVANLEKLIKSHDARILRNLNQANTNIINLVSKTTKSDEIYGKEIKSISEDVSHLYEYVKKVLPHDGFYILTTTLQNISDQLNKCTGTVNIKEELHILKDYLHEKLSGCLRVGHLQVNPPPNITREMVDAVFDQNPYYDKNTGHDTNCTNINEDYSKVIDLRYEEKPKNPCDSKATKTVGHEDETTEKQRCRTNKHGKLICSSHRRKWPRRKYNINVRSDFGSAEDEEGEDSTTEGFSEEESTTTVSTDVVSTTTLVGTTESSVK